MKDKNIISKDRLVAMREALQPIRIEVCKTAMGYMKLDFVDGCPKEACPLYETCARLQAVDATFDIMHCLPFVGKVQEVKSEEE